MGPPNAAEDHLDRLTQLEQKVEELSNGRKTPKPKASRSKRVQQTEEDSNHPKKSHIVVAKEGDKIKTIRFGEQGASTAGKPKKGESDRMKEKGVFYTSRKEHSQLKCLRLTNKVKWHGDSHASSNSFTSRKNDKDSGAAAAIKSTAKKLSKKQKNTSKT